MSRAPSLDSLNAADKTGVARALAWIETERDRLAVAALLDAAAANAKAHVLGITGPPGVGKSTLTSALVRHWRGAGESVAVVAVDPSSRASGGALLGDRTRIASDPADLGVFVRSVAARDRLGGLSELAVASTILMRALYDRVIVETVGIGQSEADVALVADTLLLALQPGSGDGLQFMKAGVMELPDVLAVTKSDLGAMAMRARGEAEASLKLAAHGNSAPEVVLVAAPQGEGIPELVEALDRHRDRTAPECPSRRVTQMTGWRRELVRERFGREGEALLAARQPTAFSSFAAMEQASRDLRETINHLR
jgi:LAO/AO transport system kinase